MKLWIDDVRPAPDGYVWVKSVNEFKRRFSHMTICLENLIDEVNLDHDAGCFAADGGDYIEILNYLEEVKENSKIHKFLIEDMKFHIHSQNPVGVENMRRIIKRNGWKEV